MIAMLQKANHITDKALAVAQDWKKASERFESQANELRTIAETNGRHRDEAIALAKHFAGEVDRLSTRPDLWPLIQALERARWKRKWSEVKAARKALEAHLGKRPSDPLFPEGKAAEK